MEKHENLLHRRHLRVRYPNRRLWPSPTNRLASHGDQYAGRLAVLNPDTDAQSDRNIYADSADGNTNQNADADGDPDQDIDADRHTHSACVFVNQGYPVAANRQGRTSRRQ